MNKTYFYFWLALVTACVTLFAACKEKEIYTTGIVLNCNELELIPGETKTLIATVQPADASNDKVTWTSSNTKVATANDSGLVTAVDNGTATITATTKDGNKTASCIATVDYRNQWIGDWDFKVEEYNWSIESGSIYDTIYYVGNISAGYALNELNIKCTENKSILVDADEFGKISKYYEGWDAHHYYTRGQFEKNKKLYMEDGFNALGYGYKFTINGIKKER
jgi:uncharacterized protein YjdB